MKLSQKLLLLSIVQTERHITYCGVGCNEDMATTQNKKVLRTHLFFLPPHTQKKTVSKMNLNKRKERLEYLLEMIENGRCFTVEKTAKKLKCSNSTVERMIRKLRKNGNNIRYCKLLKRYKII